MKKRRVIPCTEIPSLCVQMSLYIYRVTERLECGFVCLFAHVYIALTTYKRGISFVSLDYINLYNVQVDLQVGTWQDVVYLCTVELFIFSSFFFSIIRLRSKRMKDYFQLCQPNARKRAFKLINNFSIGICSRRYANIQLSLKDVRVWIQRFRPFDKSLRNSQY